MNIVWAAQPSGRMCGAFIVLETVLVENAQIADWIISDRGLAVTGAVAGVVGAVAAIAAIVVAVFNIQVPGRRQLLVRHHMLSYSDGTTTTYEVAAQLVTGRRPVTVEVLSLVPAKRPGRPWVLGQSPGPTHSGWPADYAHSLDGIRIEAETNLTLRLGRVSAPGWLIQEDGTVRVRLVALLARRTTASWRPDWMHKLTKYLAQRRSQRFNVEASVIPAVDLDPSFR